MKFILATLFLLLSIGCADAAQNFSVIQLNYASTVKQAQQNTQQLIQKITKTVSPNDIFYARKLIQLLAKKITSENIPYRFSGAQGEGNLCGSNFNKTGCVHIQQDPIYQTNSFDCNTLVQYILALINAPSLATFQHNILEINYGAFSVGNKINKNISFKNRNNFISTDFNHVNQYYHRLQDVTAADALKPYAQTISTTIDHANWFAFKAKTKHIKENVRVISKDSGPVMVKRLQNYYAKDFPLKKITFSYIPRKYLLDKSVLDKIPTPSVIEIVRDPSKWYVYNHAFSRNNPSSTFTKKSVRDIIGSNLLVSHVGILYRQQYQYKQLIYQKVNCKGFYPKIKACQVEPIYCEKQNGCNKLMMLAATNIHPKNFIWSQHNNQFYCTAAQQKPKNATALSTCNRVTTVPFSHYVTQQQQGEIPFMDIPSIIGIHVEKILA